MVAKVEEHTWNVHAAGERFHTEKKRLQGRKSSGCREQ